jgi:hypothetical protein
MKIIYTLIVCLLAYNPLYAAFGYPSVKAGTNVVVSKSGNVYTVAVSTGNFTVSNLTATYGVRASTATIPTMQGKVTVADTITASKGISVSTITASGAVTALTLTTTTKVIAPKVDLNTAFEVGVDTPTAVGQIMRDSVFIVYIGSSTISCWDWIKLGSQ